MYVFPFLRANKNLFFPPANFPLAEKPLWLAGDWVWWAQGKKWGWPSEGPAKVLTLKDVSRFCPALCSSRGSGFLSGKTQECSLTEGPKPVRLFNRSMTPKEEVTQMGLRWHRWGDPDPHLHLPTCPSPARRVLPVSWWTEGWVNFPTKTISFSPFIFSGNPLKSKEHMYD